MKRLKMIRPTRKYKKGELVYVTKNVADSLIRQGFAIVAKDMTEQDYKVTAV